MSAEKDKNELVEQLIFTINKLVVVVGILLMAILFLVYVNIERPDLSSWFTNKKSDLIKNKTKPNKAETFWSAPDTNSIGNDAKGVQIKYGRSLIEHTSKYLGPKGSVMQISNGMNCQNCHLDAGTKVWGNNYGAVFSTYPKYRARSGAIENIFKRINDCIERSLNGKALDTSNQEILAMKSYIEWLGKDVQKGVKPNGSGISDLAFLNRAIDPMKGKMIYEQQCQRCHQTAGVGLMNEDKTEYTYPPLWGEHSYNMGAGLYRMSRLAGYVKYNMPQGAAFSNPILSDEEAWDVAAFINSQPRPEKDLSKDWPKLQEKPFDHPFGPYADGFTEKQHKYGPFKAIKEKDELLKKQKTTP